MFIENFIELSISIKNISSPTRYMKLSCSATAINKSESIQINRLKGWPTVLSLFRKSADGIIWSTKLARSRSKRTLQKRNIQNFGDEGRSISTSRVSSKSDYVHDIMIGKKRQNNWIFISLDPEAQRCNHGSCSSSEGA